MKKLTVIICTLCLILCSCSNGSPADNNLQNQDGSKDDINNINSKESVVNLSISGDITTLDSVLQRDATTGNIISNAVAGLFTLDEEGKIKNEICKDYTISDDGLVYTFKLRDDFKWSNGETVDAHDFEYAWKRLSDPAVGATYSNFVSMANIINADEIIAGEKSADELAVKALDDFTFEVRMHTPMPSFLEFSTQTTFLPLNEEFVEQKGDDHGTTAENTLYCGAYLIDSWEAEYEIVLKKNPDYANADSVKNDKVIVKIVKDTNTNINLFETGQLDAIDCIGEVAELYKDDPKVERFEQLTMRFFVINNESPVFSNLNARKAVACIMDKEFIVDELYKDGSTVANYIIPRGIAFNKVGKDYRDVAADYDMYDVEEGKNYWAKAKEELGIENCSIRMMVGESTLSKKMGEFIQSVLQENLEGMTVVFEQVTAKNDIQKEIDGEFDIKFSSWGNASKDAAYEIQTFSEGFYGNTARFVSQEYNDLYKLMMNDYVLDIEKRWECFEKAEKILIKDLVGIIPAHQTVKSFLIQDNIKGFYYTNLSPSVSYKYIEKR